jgi:hypothetical protein
VELTEDDERRYRKALERRDGIRDCWIAEGRPIFAEGSVGQLVEHPLVKAMREHDLLVTRLAQPLQRRHRGRGRRRSSQSRSVARRP